MDPKLKCVMLIDDDRLANLITKIDIDNADITEHVKRMLTVEEAISYLINAGIENVDLPFPELIFLDIVLPRLSGWDFIEQYRKIKDDLPLQPVIYMLSSHAVNQDILQVSNAPELSGLCEKPLTPEILSIIIDKHYLNRNGNKKRIIQLT